MDSKPLLARATILLRVLPDTFANPDLRRLELAFAGFNVAEFGTWIAILVYAYNVGGAAAAGMAGALQLIPGALFAPCASFLGDRFPRRRMLIVGYVSQAITYAATGAVLFAGVALPTAITVAGVAATTVTLTRPVQGAILPALARSPSELIAANVAAGWIEGLSIFAGPLVTGMVLAVSSPGLVFVIMAAVVLYSALLTARIDRGPTPDSDTHSDEESAGLVTGLLKGFTTVVHDSRPRLVIGLMSIHFVLVGALDIVLVILAVRILHLGGPGAGYLNATFGLGGVIGAMTLPLLVSRPRMSLPLIGGTAAWGAAFVLIAIAPGRLLSPLMIALAGAGRPLVDVSGRTLLQRTVSSGVLSRTFGILEGLSMGAQALGMALVPLLFGGLGDRGAFLAAGALLPVAAACAWPGMMRIDAQDEADAARISTLRGTTIFARLPMPALESLAHQLVPCAFPAGSLIIRQGDPGDYFYVLRSGDVDISIDGRKVAAQGPGSFFGEIALLRSVPRTATVTARTDTAAFAISRRDFLEAVTGHPQSEQAAHGVVHERLATMAAPVGAPPRS